MGFDDFGLVPIPRGSADKNNTRSPLKHMDLSDVEVSAWACWLLMESYDEEMYVCEWTPKGEPCEVTELLVTVASSIIRIREEIKDHGEYWEPRPLDQDGHRRPGSKDHYVGPGSRDLAVDQARLRQRRLRAPGGPLSPRTADDVVDLAGYEQSRDRAHALHR